MSSKTENINIDDLFEDEVVETGSSISFKEIIYLCLNKWYWFLISVVVMLGIAFFYVLRTPQVYTRSAQLLIKEDAKGTSVSSDVSSVFSQMGISQTNVNVSNELIAIQSPSVVLEVVKRLGLDIDYRVDGLFHEQTIYGATLPVKVTLDSIADNAPLSFNLQLQADGTALLTHLASGELEWPSTTYRLELGQSVKTPVALITVSASSGYAAGASYPLIHVERTGLYGATSSCRGRFSAELSSKDATVIDLSYNDVCTQRAEDFLNTLISVYNANWVKDKNQITVSTSQFINERLGVLERELGDVDTDISSFKSRNLIPDAEAASSLYMSQSQITGNQILNLTTQLSMAKFVRNHINSVAGKNQLLPANSGLENNGIEQQIATYNTTQLQRNNLVSNSSEQNPIVVDLDQSLASMRRAILTSIDNLVVTLNTQIDNLRQSEQRTTALISANPDQAKYLQTVGRQQKVKEALYLFLLQKREENELSQAFTAYNTRIITPPSGNFIPVSPKRTQILLVGFVIGLALPFLFIVVREKLNSTVRGRKDIENLSLPFLGEIPLYAGKQKKKKPLFGKKQDTKDSLTIVVREGSRNLMNEAFRVLRTNLEFMVGNKKEGGNVIVLTSFNPGSGKSFLTLNIALSLAIKGKRVLVIDGDLRRASASKLFGSPEQGFSDYLAGRADSVARLLVSGKLLHPADKQPTTTDADKADPYANLMMLPVGTIPPNPTELLYEERFGRLLADMRKDFDYVFIDCPPVDIMADTQIIEQHADRTIFIIRAGLLERSMLPELDRIYAAKKFKNMSLILNGTEGSGHRYGYKYGYRYGYKYGYHYGYEKE